jgi:CheY-like chemotaxis protein
MNPESALKSFKSDFYALILIEIMIPKTSGFSLYEQLKRVDPDIKVCFLTASEMYYERNRGCFKHRSVPSKTNID